jgi:hypothetical protein
MDPIQAMPGLQSSVDFIPFFMRLRKKSAAVIYLIKTS